MATKRKPSQPQAGVTRRGLITSVGAGVVAAATLRRTAAAPPPQDVTQEQMTRLTLRINGRSHRLLVEPRWSLLYVLRERLGLTGTKPGCERGECGACTVLIDGRPRYACMTLALEADGSEITTVEGLLRGEELGDTQKAFVEHDAFQCGYCTSGQIMAAEGLLRANPHPSRDEVRLGMSGNLCRCGAYAHIVRAVEKAAELKGSRGAR
jgi:xanthine dehydrogenase YagT iron-sulfur-binding subunit